MSTESGTCWFVPYEAFRAATDTKTYGAFQDMPHTQPAKRPTFNTVIFGAVIALAQSGVSFSKHVNLSIAGTVARLLFSLHISNRQT